MSNIYEGRRKACLSPCGGSSELWSVLMIANPKHARNIRLLLVTGVVESVRGR